MSVLYRNVGLIPCGCFFQSVAFYSLGKGVQCCGNLLRFHHIGLQGCLKFFESHITITGFGIDPGYLVLETGVSDAATDLDQGS